jgi:hypothetical protein
MALNAQILVSILAHESSGDGIAQTLRATPATYALALTDGTGANQAQLVWSDSRTIPAQNTDQIDLTSLPDDRGSVSFSDIKVAYIRNSGTAQLSVVAGANVPNSWAGFGYADESGSEFVIKAGGAAMVSAPTATGLVVTSSLKIIRIDGSAGGTYDIVLIGEGTVT